MRLRNQDLLFLSVLAALALGSVEVSAQSLVREKDVNTQEGQDLRGTAFGDPVGLVFGADATSGRVYAWSDLLAAQDGDTREAVLSFVVSGDLADLGWSTPRRMVFVGHDNLVSAYSVGGLLSDPSDQIDFGRPVSGVAVNGDQIYVSDSEGSRVTVYERRIGTPTGVDYEKTSFGAGAQIIHGLAYDATRDRMWISDDARKLVTVYDNFLSDSLDGATLTPGNITIDVGPGANLAPALGLDGFVEIYDMEFADDTGLAYMCTGGHQRVVGFNRAGEVAEVFNPGQFCGGLAVHGDMIWVSDLVDQVRQYQRVGANNYRFVRAFRLETCPGTFMALAYDPNHDMLWRWAWRNSGFCAYNRRRASVWVGRLRRRSRRRRRARWVTR
jgi:hypothetical protein